MSYALGLDQLPYRPAKDVMTVLPKPQPPEQSTELSQRGTAGAKTPRVSVVVPVYAAAATLARTIKSLQRQTVRDWEAILVIDGSPDNSGVVAADLAARDPRLNVIHQPNKGVSRARNTGLAAARGGWIVFLDADDALTPRALAQFLDGAAHAPQAGVIVGRAERVTADGRAWPAPHYDLSDAFSVLARECALVIHAGMVRRDLVTAVGGFDPALRTSEDWDLWQRIARTGARFASIDAVVARYHSQAGSLTKNIRQLANDALWVMRRGHSCDPRVADPAPAHRDGAPTNDLSHSELGFVIWSAAREVAAGAPTSVFDLLAGAPDIDLEPDHVGALIADAMADYLGVLPGDLADQWPTLSERVNVLLAQAFPGPARARLRALANAAVRQALGARDPDAIDLARPLAPLIPGEGDLALRQLVWRGNVAGVLAAPALGALSPAQASLEAVEAIRAGPLRATLKTLKAWRHSAFWIAAARGAFDMKGLGLVSQGRRGLSKLAPILSHRAKRVLADAQAAVVAAAQPSLAAAPNQCAHTARLAAILQEEHPLVPALRVVANQKNPPAGSGAPALGRRPDAVANGGAWNAFFAAEDPWRYTSAYEQTKYDQTLSLIQPRNDMRALELACAEGHFTAQLANRVGALLATDISEVALARAKERVGEAAHVQFAKADLFKAIPAGEFDLIVCSEVLYYARSQGLLAQTARRIAARLAPGGAIVLAHANLVADEPDHTGFDWGHRFGAKSIALAFAETPGLALEQEIRTPLYRIQRFVKLPRGASLPPPVRTTAHAASDLEPHVRRAIMWGGAETSRVVSQQRHLSVRIPVLAYEAADTLSGSADFLESFKAQIGYLRRHGYWGVSPKDLAEALKTGKPLYGRPVAITFDGVDAGLDKGVIEVLEHHDFQAILSVRADHVGRTGGLSWTRLSAMQRAGFAIATQGASGEAFTRLTIEGAARDLARATGLHTRHLGSAPEALVLPFGAADPAIRRLLPAFGISLAFTRQNRVATVSDDRWRVARIGIAAHEDLASFVRKLGQPAD